VSSIRRRDKKWQVRWQGPDGRSRSRTASTAKEARSIARQVDADPGTFDEPAKPRRVGQRGARPALTLRDLHQAYLSDLKRIGRKANTLYRYATILSVWERWLQLTFKRLPPPDVLSKQLLRDHYDWLLETGLHGKPRGPETARKHMVTIQNCWAWAVLEDDWSDITPPARRLALQRPPTTPAVAPTWAEMDRAILAAPPAQARLAVLLRFTGLRVQQAMELRWEDFDLDRAELTIRGELGKSLSERGGRVIPISHHLVGRLRADDWEKEGSFVVPSNRIQGERERKARARDMAAAWARAGVREAAWRKQPHHAFRKGFTSGLHLEGADVEAVEYLIGHSAGIRRHYVDPRALSLVNTVALIPAIGEREN